MSKSYVVEDHNTLSGYSDVPHLMLHEFRDGGERVKIRLSRR